MTQNAAQIVSQMLEAHYTKSENGFFGGQPSKAALSLMKGGLLQDYLNEAGPQGLVREFDSALTWATPTNYRDRLLILSCAAAADILPDDEPDQLSWRIVKSRDPEPVQKVHLTKQPGQGFGFSLVTIGSSVYVRRLQPFSPASSSGNMFEGDKVISVCGKTLGHSFTQKDVILLLKRENEVQLTVSHVSFDGKGCPETTFDRESPKQSAALENSYKLALDLSASSQGTTLSNGSSEKREGSSEKREGSSEKREGISERNIERSVDRCSDKESFYRNNGMSVTGCDTLPRGTLQADIRTNKRAGTLQADIRTNKRSGTGRRLASVGSVGDSMSTTSSSHDIRTHSTSSGSDSRSFNKHQPGSLGTFPGKLSKSPGKIESGESSPGSRAFQKHHETRPGVQKCASTKQTSPQMSSHSSVNKDFYRESLDSLPRSVQSMGSTEFVVLPNNGSGIGIGISGKRGVIIRNILQGSIADKDGRLQIGDHIIQVNEIKCGTLGHSDTKDIIIPELRNSTPTVKLLVQHVAKRRRSPPSSSHATPSKVGPGSTLPSQKHGDQPPDLLLPEALWSDAHPTAPIAYRFGTVILPAPAWIGWSKEKHFVTLTRLANGFGFSIMDYKEPSDKSEDSGSVLIIRQITPFGAADMEGHLTLGERIMAVNGEVITNQSIEDIVRMIKPCPVLQLRMCRPVESTSWRSLLSTKISAIPLVSGPRSTCQGARSSSTLNVTKGESRADRIEQSYNYQPRNTRHCGDSAPHFGSSGDTIHRFNEDDCHYGNVVSSSESVGKHDKYSTIGLLRSKNPSINSKNSDSKCEAGSYRPGSQDSMSNQAESHLRHERGYSADYSTSTSCKSSGSNSNNSIGNHSNTEHSYSNHSNSNHGNKKTNGSSGTVRRRYQPSSHGGAVDLTENTVNSVRSDHTMPQQPTINSNQTDLFSVNELRSGPKQGRVNSIQPHAFSNSPTSGYHPRTNPTGEFYATDMTRAPAERQCAEVELRSPRPPTRTCIEGMRSPQFKRNFYSRPGVLSPSKSNVAEQQYTKPTSNSSGSGSELNSIVSSVPGMNNNELNDLWKRRRVKSSQQQLSRV